MDPIQQWSFSESSPTTSPSEDSAAGTETQSATSNPDPADPAEAGITAWTQGIVTAFPAILTFLVAFGLRLSGEQQAAATGLVSTLSAFGLITWRTFRRRRGTR